MDSALRATCSPRLVRLHCVVHIERAFVNLAPLLGREGF